MYLWGNQYIEGTANALYEIGYPRVLPVTMQLFGRILDTQSSGGKTICNLLKTYPKSEFLYYYLNSALN